MSKLYVDELAPKTTGQTITLPAGMIVGAEVKQIDAQTTRSNATAFADDLDFGFYTPKLTNSTILIQGVANFDSQNDYYCYYKWVINGSAFLSTGSTPSYTHGFFSYTSLNNVGYLPSTIITSVENTDGSNVTVVCQGATGGGTLAVNRSGATGYSGSPSSVMFLEIAK
jgi:hypothetical protein